MARSADMEEKLEEISRMIAEDVTRRLRDYEAIHGTVKPAPASARITKRSNEAQIMAIMKQHLIRTGWLTKE